MNLDIIPWPDYDGFEYELMFDKTPLDQMNVTEKGGRIATCFSSRSCPWQCTFCFHSSGKKYRKRSLASFFEELEYLIERYKINGFFMADEYFVSSRDFVSDFCERIRQYNLKWVTSGRVDNITPEILKMLIDAGCKRLHLGVESADNRILKSMRKGTIVEQIEKCFNLCYEFGMGTQGNLIFGDLEETIETAQNSINWWKKHPHFGIKLSWIIVYPGSFIYKIACERGIIKNPVKHIKDGCPEINISKMTLEERKQIALEVILCDTNDDEVIKNAVIRKSFNGTVNLEGYCPNCGKKVCFSSIDVIRSIKSETCQECKKILRLRGLDYINYSLFNTNLHRKFDTIKIGIWPVVTGISSLFERLPFLNSPNVFLIDSSEYKQGLSIFGKNIESPKIIATENIETVLLTVTTSVASSITNEIKQKYLMVKTIDFIGNYAVKTHE